MSEIEYKHRNLKEAIFNLCCLAHIGVHDKTLIENLNADCERELVLYEELIKKYKVLRITKDKQYYALSTISDIIRDFNKGEFVSAEIALQEITSILQEVLL